MNRLRLQKILNLIPEDTKTMVDLGTDHGFLAIAAVLEKNVQHVIATDINSQPLFNAQKNVARNCLNQQITLILSDGLNFLKDPGNESLKIDFCVIAGLGATTIINILKNSSSQIDNYVICSNTQPSLIREWANEHGITLAFEEFFYDRHRAYWLLWLKKEAKKVFVPVTQTLFGDFKWFQFSGDYKKYLLSKKDHDQKILQQLPKGTVKLKQENDFQLLLEFLELWDRTDGIN